MIVSGVHKPAGCACRGDCACVYRRLLVVCNACTAWRAVLPLECSCTYVALHSMLPIPSGVSTQHPAACTVLPHSLDTLTLSGVSFRVFCMHAAFICLSLPLHACVLELLVLE